MKKVVLILIVLALGFACKTSKKAAHTPAIVVEEIAEPVVVPTAAPVVIPEPVYEAPVVVRTEEVKIYENQTEKAATFDFYVIIGSFSIAANAEKNKSEMIAKGFTPVVLSTESGLYRVAVEQTNSETAARSKISQIRSRYPEHRDVWLLKKK